MTTLREVMGSIRALLTRETSEARDLLDDLTANLETDLDGRESRAGESPSEALERLQGEIAQSDPFDEVRGKIEGD